MFVVGCKRRESELRTDELRETDRGRCPKVKYPSSSSVPSLGVGIAIESATVRRIMRRVVVRYSTERCVRVLEPSTSSALPAQMQRARPAHGEHRECPKSGERSVRESGWTGRPCYFRCMADAPGPAQAETRWLIDGSGPLYTRRWFGAFLRDSQRRLPAMLLQYGKRVAEVVQDRDARWATDVCKLSARKSTIRHCLLGLEQRTL